MRKICLILAFLCAACSEVEEEIDIDHMVLNEESLEYDQIIAGEPVPSPHEQIIREPTDTEFIEIQ